MGITTQDVFDHIENVRAALKVIERDLDHLSSVARQADVPNPTSHADTVSTDAQG